MKATTQTILFFSFSSLSHHKITRTMKTSIYPILKIGRILSLLMFTSINSFSQDHTLYGIIGDYLAVIDPNTGTATEVAPLTPTFTYINGLTYEPNLDKLLVVVDWRFNPRLASIDRCSGEVTIIGFIDQPSLDIKLVEGLAYNPDDGLLYASGYETPPPANYWSRRLMTVDPLSGNATAVANIAGTCENEADVLAFTSGAYYSMDGCPNPVRLYSIDLTTGNSTYIGANSTTASRLAAHPVTGALYSISPGNRKLYNISATNGGASLIGETHSSTDFDGGLVRSITFGPGLDLDEDGVSFCTDNCPNIHNPSQEDFDIDGLGDACDPMVSITNVTENMVIYIEGLGLSNGITRSLIRKLDRATDRFCDGRSANSVISPLNSNINMLQALSGNQITEADADFLIAQIQTLIDAILAGTVECDGTRPAPPGIGPAADATDYGFELFPNPTNGNLTLQLPAFLGQEVAVRIHDAYGRQVFAIPVQELQNPSINLNLTEQSLPNGVYFLAVSTAEEQLVKQFVLAR